MSIQNDNFREWNKTNLIDDLIILFPKLQENIIIRRSDGSYLRGNVIRSNIYKNFYAEWDDKYHSWFLPVIFFDPINGSMNKFMDINELIYSNFSYKEIIIIKNALNDGIERDMNNASPVFTSISRDIRTYRKNFLKKENTHKTNFNIDDFLNLPPLKI
jgi:hypothetical protein